MNVHGQGSKKPVTKAEQEAWDKAHPEDVVKAPSLLDNQATNRTAAQPTKPTMVATPNAVRNSEDAQAGTAPSASTVQESGSKGAAPVNQPTLRDEEIPAHYQQASDYRDPAVRARLEQDLKQKGNPVGAGSGSSTAKSAPQPVVRAVEFGQVNAPSNDSPVYRDTGNPEADMAAYMAAKAQWTRESEEKAKLADPEYRALQEKIRVQEEAESKVRRAREQEAAEEAAAIAKKQLEHPSTEK